ncbi:ATP-binding cassette sub-family A member 3-like isoform X2 [Teleopsis dalmanni]|uniref:ATP-binding cassette sub-family A member 3-like isoform X2 n=1 Tax=Teleopsis dalmanni TaxID=139649 RepID=UPI0018CE89CB|nr:ATP-binding cassette sub-family A member 3-like isoform X2 [Teleopsis dalmanni]
MVECEKFPSIVYDNVNLVDSWTNIVNELSNRREKYFSSTKSSDFNVYVPQMIIAFAPNNSVAIENIMSFTAPILKGMKLIGIESCDLLRERMEAEYFFAGACFDDDFVKLKTSVDGSHILPYHLNYTLVFPSELRIYNDTYMSSNWHTNHLFNFLMPPSERIGKDNTGGYVGYVREGFSALQHAIFVAYLNLHVDLLYKEYWYVSNKIISNLMIRRFPHSDYIVDKLIDKMEDSLPLLIAMSYLLPITVLIKHIVEEKENNLQSILRNMGASHGLQLIAWFILGFFQLILSSIILVTIIKIPWNDGHGILTNSSWSALLVLMFFYDLVATAFAIFISIFCTVTRTAIISSTIIWTLTFFPHASCLIKYTNKMLTNVFIFLFPNTTFGMAVDNVLSFEVFGGGFHFHHYFEVYTLEIPFSTGFLSVIMVFQSIVYIVMAIYIEKWIPGKIGAAKQCKLPFICGSENVRTSRIANKRVTRVIEVDAYQQTVLSVENVSKNYDNQYIVKNVSINLYENETAILMGHNGSGKTTLLKMIAGLLTPSRGDIVINGYNTKYHTHAFLGVGVSIHESSLFSNLTVKDQLLFFCRMKNIEYAECKQQVRKYLESTPLLKNLNFYTDTLSIGLRHILALCCALIGDSKFVVLTDPFEGLDNLSRRHAWNLLLRERPNRTLLIATNSYEIAESFGDRIAIMGDGELRCVGTANFLKQVYCSDFRLNILSGEHFQIDELTKVLQKYIPNIEPDYALGNKLSYVLDEKYLILFDDLIDEIEKKSFELSIITIELIERSLRDVFVQLGADDASFENPARHQQILKGISKDLSESDPIQLFKKYERLKSYKLKLSHWRAYLYKRFKYEFQHTTTIVLMLLLPIIYILVSFTLQQLSLDGYYLNPMTYKLDQYLSSVTAIETEGLVENSADIEYQQIIFATSYPHVAHVISVPFETYIMEHLNSKATNVNEKYLMAATFGEYLIVWFNNHPLHTAPMSLSYMQNAIAKQLLGENVFVEISFAPLPSSNKHKELLIHYPFTLKMVMALCISFCLSFLWSISIIFVIKERVTKFRLLQFIAGAKKSSFILSAFFYDVLIVFVTSFITVVTLILIERERFAEINFIMAYFVTLITGGICVISMNHVLAKFFKDPLIAFCIVISIHFFGITSFATFADIFYNHYDELFYTTNRLEGFLLMLPLFTQCSALTSIFLIYDMSILCRDQIINKISIDVENCKIIPNCCIEYTVWNFQYGILSKICILLAITLSFWILLFLMENIKLTKIINWKNKSFKNILSKSSSEQYKYTHGYYKNFKVDEEVINEQLTATKTNNYEMRKNPLTCGFISKVYHKKAVINGISLTLSANECVSVLGVNTSGKSTLLQLLAGEVDADNGFIVVKGYSFTYEQDEAFKHIGYFPQKSHLLKEYKVKEFLYIICLLHGIPINEIKTTYEDLAKALGIYDYLNKSIGIICKGVERRVCLLIAMLGNTSLVLFDHPTLSTDPTAARIIWNVILQLKNSGKACVIATNDIHESIVLSDRVAILSTLGFFYSLTTLQGIRDKFVDVYMLRVTMKNITHIVPALVVRRMSKLKKFVQNKFPTAFIFDSGSNFLVYIIPVDENIKLSTIFKEMQTNAPILSIEDFLIKKCPLRPLFRHLMIKASEDYLRP